MLFSEDAYFAYRLPEPQYLGAKYKLLNWISQFIPPSAKIGLDAFAGTQSVAYLLKQLGLKVITNDFLSFNHQIGLALIENNAVTLTNEDVARLFAPNADSGEFTQMRELFTDLFFTADQAAILDNFRANVAQLSDKYKRAMALAVMNRSLSRKITMGHFGHTQALVYANDPLRVRRNPSLARPVRVIFEDFLPQYNAAVFDNQQANASFGENILDLLPRLLEQESIDFAYFDPPYCDSHADYQSFYHLTETYTEYWRDKQFVNSIKRYDPQRFSGFDKKRDIIASLHHLFSLAQEIPHWLISYNDRSYPNLEELSRIIRQYKQVQVEAKTYRNGRGGKGSVAGSREILFVCQHKPIFAVHMSMPNQNRPFSYWKNLYESDQLEDFNFSADGLLWLKIKSIARKELMAEFLANYSVPLPETSLADKFIQLYDLLSQNLEPAHRQLDTFIVRKNKEQAEALDTDALVSELYKLRYFDWGGDYKNALDKYLVDSYIKVYSNYDQLFAKFDTEISRAVQGYVLCSWYNHWSSILIEHFFKSHPNVLPTVGQIKKVDFFVNNIPFDLKVTYLPANFIEAKRKERGLKPELTELKLKARQTNISFTSHKKAADTYYEIVEKMKDRNSETDKAVLQSIKDVRLAILEETQINPRTLIKNLYEQQGELRFDAANRLFLVLVDTEDFDNSWKLKRNLALLQPSIQRYLDSFATKTPEDLKIRFHYKNRPQEFTALSDVIFVVK